MNYPDSNPSKRLSVILITWNERRDLEKCLRSLRGAVQLDKDEIIVVDNGSSDGTDAMVESDFPEVIYRRLPTNLGPGSARNRGIGLAEGEYIMLLDNDTIVPALDRPFGDIVVEIFENNPDIGLFSFLMEYMDGRPQRNYRGFPTIIMPLLSRVPQLRKLSALRRLHESSQMEDLEIPSDGDAIVDVDWVLGANQVFRRSTVIQTGGFDEKMRYGAEDLDLCLRIWRLGLRVSLANHLSIKHKYRRRGTKLNRFLFRELRSFLYLFWREKTLWQLSPSRHS